MSDYTPSTGEVRRRYAYARSDKPGHKNQSAIAEFDRWLAAHDAEVRAATITEFESLYFGPGWQTREWVANAMRERHGLPPRPNCHPANTDQSDRSE